MDAAQFQRFLEIQQELIQAIRGMPGQDNLNNSSHNQTNRNHADKVKNFKCEKYDPDTKADTYVEYFEAQCRLWKLMENDEETTKIRKDLFVSCLKPETFHKLRVAFRNSNVNFENQPYDAIKEKFLSLFHVKRTRFKALVQFWNCTRVTDQSFESFANTLKELSLDCGYNGDNLDRQLRDRFATGLNHKRIEIELKQRWPDLKILENNGEREVTFAEVFAIAQAGEAAERDLEPDANRTEIFKIKTKEHSKVRKTTNAGQPKILHEYQCRRCGQRTHPASQCHAVKHKCESCGTIGHYGSCCIKKGRAKIATSNRQKNKLHYTRGNSQYDTSDSDTENAVIGRVYHIGAGKKIDVKINGKPIVMEWDPGASFSIIDTKIWQKIGSPSLTKGPILTAYGGFQIRSVGKTSVDVAVGNLHKCLDVVIVPHKAPALFGLPWCEKFNMTFPIEVYTVKATASVNNDDNHNIPTDNSYGLRRITARKLEHILQENQTLFQNDTGTVKNFEVNIHIKSNAIPVHIAARPIKFGIQQNVENELKRLLDKGIISEIDPNKTPVEWATPTVNVPKKNGEIRICGDFRTTINPVLVTEYFPVPLFEQTRKQLANGELFSKIDLKDCYLQFPIAPESRKYLVISTHKGYFQYNRLPFGIANAPAICQRFLQKLLEDIPGVSIYLDDIAITRRNDDDHLRSLQLVLQRLKDAGLKIRRDKCTFLNKKIEYLGHEFTKNGVSPLTNKISAIQNAPTPTEKNELRSFLGLVNYYEKFVPNLQMVAADLYELIRTKAKWKWTTHHQHIFEKIKERLEHPKLLIGYDPAKKLYLSCDASDKGVGAVLYHQTEQDGEQPIAFASRKLSPAERNYAVIDREALAIVFAIKKFDLYLRGTPFILKTDHKPLQHLFGTKRNLPKLVNNRLTRWALFVGQYDYRIEYRKGSTNVIADCLSRLPNRDEITSSVERKINNMIQYLQEEKYSDMRLSRFHLRRETYRDQVLKRVKWCLRTNWASYMITADIKPYYDKRHEISIEDNILLWQGRIIVPETLRKLVLQRLHSGHPGIVAMKALARYYVWWPKIDTQIEEYSKRCHTCQSNRDREPQLPIYAWSIPERNWERVHLDYAGPFEDRHWLVVVDALSKWIEVKPVRVTTAEVLCETLEDIFVVFGYPKIIVTDNGPQFTSNIFKNYCNNHGIKHITSSPYHPRTNGLAERLVRTFKSRMKATRTPGNDIKQRLRDVLFSYRNTPHSTTGKSPAEAMFGRQLTTIFDNLKPDLQQKMRFKHLSEELTRGKNEREYYANQAVFTRTSLDKKWHPATIGRRNGRYSYIVKTADGCERRRHAEHLKPRLASPPVTYIPKLLPKDHQIPATTNVQSEQGLHPESSASALASPAPTFASSAIPLSTSIVEIPTLPTTATLTPSKSLSSKDVITSDDPSGNIVIRRSSRIRRAPIRFSPSN